MQCEKYFWSKRSSGVWFFLALGLADGINHQPTVFLGFDRQTYTRTPSIGTRRLSIMYHLPAEILQRIYTLDGTYKDHFKTHVLEDGQFRMILFAREMGLDREYAIRNWCEADWAVHPRYVSQGKVYGSYIRNGYRIADDPL